MHCEIEQKYRLRDPDGLRRRLRAVGALRVRTEHECNTILDTPLRSLRTRNCGLRLRECRSADNGAASATLCYKGAPRAGSMKSREELETAVSPAECEKLAEIFARLDYQTVLRFEKRRETWELSVGDAAAIVTIDELPIAGFFAEIEADSEARVWSAAQLLELPEEDIEHNTYVAIAVKIGSRDGQAGPVELLFDS